MDIGAGQSPLPGIADVRVASADEAGLADEDALSPEQEAAFWAELRRWYPSEFGGADAAELRAAAPGPELVADLVGLAITDEDLVADLALIEVIAAWQRVVSFAHAHAARAAAALSRRACVQVPGGSVPVGPGRQRYTAVRAAGTEVAIRTGCSVRSGELLVRDGRAFDGALVATGDALARGEIDPPKARMIADRLGDAALEVALAVEDAVLPGAGLRSPAQLERDLTRSLIEVDPTDAELRYGRAARARRVTHPRLLPDGMAGIWAVLPAEQATLIDAALTAAARTAQAAGDPRTADQLRADGLVDLVLGTGRSPRGGRPQVRVDVLVPLSTLLGLDEAPGELAGYGALSATQARALAAGGVWRRLVTDPLSGAVLDVGRTRYRPPAALREHVLARDGTCARPGCVVPARRAELDHTIPFGPVARGETAQHNLAPLCPADHRAKSLGVLHLDQPEPGVLDWTTATGLRLRVVPGDRGRAALAPVDDRTGPRSAEPPPF